MAVNQNPPRFEAHWRTVSWAVLDKSLQLVFGLAFLLLVVRPLPREEFGLQSLAAAILLVLSQLFRAVVLIPVVKYVAEAGGPARVAATGTALYVTASAAAALLLWAGRDAWAAVFHKPELAAVLVPSACLLAAGSARDAAVASLEGQRRLRSVFLLDLAYYLLAIGGLVVWRLGAGGRDAAAVQWVQAAAAALGAAIAVTATRRYLLRRPARADARRILRFGVSFLGSGFGASLQQQADTLLAGRLMDAGGVATYGAAKQLFRVFNVLAQAISQVLLPTVSRLHAAGRHADLRVLFEKSACFLSLVLFPVCAGVILLAHPILDLLFQGRYADSEPVFRILVGSAFALPLASVGSPFLTGLGRLGSLLVLTWTGLGIGLALAALWIPAWGPSGAAAATLVAALYGAVTRTWVLRRLLGFRVVGIVARTRDAVAFAKRRLRRAPIANSRNVQDVQASGEGGSDRS